MKRSSEDVSSPDATAPKQPKSRIPLPTPPSVFCTSRGERAAQEDRLLTVDDGWHATTEDHEATAAEDGAQSRAGWPACRFYGVFDGHSGDAASEAASRLVWARLQPVLSALQGRCSGVPADGDVEDALREAFRATEEELLAAATDGTERAGTTAVCALLLGDEAVWVAHVGDSRCVMCHAERAVRLTEDHKPNVPGESARIVAAGGEVTTPHARGIENVPRLNGALSVSRALGNAAFKRGEGGAALSATPDVRRVACGDFDSFLLLASDGLWDVLSDDAAVAIVLQELQSKWPRKTAQARAQAACDKLVREVLLSGRCSDNVTAVLVLLQNFS